MNQFWDLLAAILCAIFGHCGDGDCRAVEHAKTTHTVCSFQVSDVVVKTHLKDKDGTPYRNLPSLVRALTAQPDPKNSDAKTSKAPKPAAPLMVMNGGMYHSNLDAVGLYIEDSQQITGVSTKGGWGNFHLLPNGVFWMKGRKLGVTETKAFIKFGAKPDFATQSGPMLVTDGKLHPRFLKKSDSLKIRNGVGVSADGKTIHFAISRSPISFHDFGTLFRDILKTPNALYLDGTVSAIRAGSITQGGWRELGPMISVVKR